MTANDWAGKSTASANGWLDSTHVKAFVYTNFPFPSTTYAFAVSGDNTKGGATFTTNANGEGPGNTQNWFGTNYFDGGKEF